MPMCGQLLSPSSLSLLSWASGLISAMAVPPRYRYFSDPERPTRGETSVTPVLNRFRRSRRDRPANGVTSLIRLPRGSSRRLRPVRPLNGLRSSTGRSGRRSSRRLLRPDSGVRSFTSGVACRSMRLSFCNFAMGPRSVRCFPPPMSRERRFVIPGFAATSSASR